MPFVRKDGESIWGQSSRKLRVYFVRRHHRNDEIDFTNSLVSLREALTLANLESNLDSITFCYELERADQSIFGCFADFEP